MFQTFSIMIVCIYVCMFINISGEVPAFYSGCKSTYWSFMCVMNIYIYIFVVNIYYIHIIGFQLQGLL